MTQKIGLRVERGRAIRPAYEGIETISSFSCRIFRVRLSRDPPRL